jgi:hypothetical protein
MIPPIGHQGKALQSLRSLTLGPRTDVQPTSGTVVFLNATTSLLAEEALRSSDRALAAADRIDALRNADFVVTMRIKCGIQVGGGL